MIQALLGFFAKLFSLWLGNSTVNALTAKAETVGNLKAKNDALVKELSDVELSASIRNSMASKPDVVSDDGFRRD